MSTGQHQFLIASNCVYDCYYWPRYFDVVAGLFYRTGQLAVDHCVAGKSLDDGPPTSEQFVRKSSRNCCMLHTETSLKTIEIDGSSIATLFQSGTPFGNNHDAREGDAVRVESFSTLTTTVEKYAYDSSATINLIRQHTNS